MDWTELEERTAPNVIFGRLIATVIVEGAVKNGSRVPGSAGSLTTSLAIS
jgi:hypothetical protein